MQRRYFHHQRLYLDDQQVWLAVGWTNNYKRAKISFKIQLHFQGWESVGGLTKAKINVGLNISKTYFNSNDFLEAYVTLDLENDNGIL